MVSAVIVVWIYCCLKTLLVLIPGWDHEPVELKDRQIHLEEALVLADRQLLNVPSGQTSIRALVTTNIRSLNTKMLHLSLVLQSPIHIQHCVACIKEAWLNPDMANSFVSIDSFRFHSLDGVSNKTTGGGGAT